LNLRAGTGFALQVMTVPAAARIGRTRQGRGEHYVPAVSIQLLSSWRITVKASIVAGADGVPGSCPVWLCIDYAERGQPFSQAALRLAVLRRVPGLADSPER